MTDKQFEKLPPEKKRVAIAKDVLQAVRSKKYIPITGTYIHPTSRMDELGNADIKDNIRKIKNRDVCAMGGVILSVTKYRNRLNFDDIGTKATYFDTNKSRKILTGIFSPIQLILIEDCFEGTSGTRLGATVMRGDSSQYYPSEVAVSFYERYPTENKRLIAIMKNIIRNKGKFIPKQDIKA